MGAQDMLSEKRSGKDSVSSTQIFLSITQRSANRAQVCPRVGRVAFALFSLSEDAVHNVTM